MHYEQLTQEQRYHISGLLKAGNAQNNIAKELGVDKSTISRELRRNRGERGYRPKQAEELAVHRRVSAAKHISFTVEVKKAVIEKIKLDWSPEQISGCFKKDELFEISHERIYQFLLEDKKTGGQLYKHLRHSGNQLSDAIMYFGYIV